MTILALLRGLAFTGVQLTPHDGGLDYVAPAALTGELLAGVAEHKMTLLQVLEPSALRQRFRISLEQPIPGGEAVVLAWIGVERETFSATETHTWRERIVEREASGEPAYIAAILACQDIALARVDLPVNDSQTGAAAT